MTAGGQLDKLLSTRLAEVRVPNSDASEMDTRRLLATLAASTVWSDSHWQIFNFLSKRVDIGRKIHLRYARTGLPIDENELTDERWLDLAVAIFLKAVLDSDPSLAPELVLKRFNAFFKVLDLHRPEWLVVGSDLAFHLESAWAALFAVLPKSGGDRSVAEPASYESANGGEVPVTVLFYEGTIARAYLAIMRSLGLTPKKIINLVAAKDIATHRRVGRWLPGSMRERYAASQQRRKIHHWPTVLAGRYRTTKDAIDAEIEGRLFIGKKIISDAQELLPLSQYSTNVESVLIDDLKDPKLEARLRHKTPDLILFTGGGIMPASLLGIDGLRFLHVHPGYLPQIRGADCALWSTLLTGHLSASCFFMARGIDIGDIVRSAWLPGLGLKSNLEAIDPVSRYRMVYAFIDPWVRAYVLRQVLVEDPALAHLPSVPQAEADGTTFHFMHNSLREVALMALLSRQWPRSPALR